MTTAVAIEGKKSVARPLHVLVPLIKEDLEEGQSASERAGLPYYQAAGEKLIEAKAQMKQGEFIPWMKRNFKISASQSQLYMSYARATSNKQNNGAPFSSLREWERESGVRAESSTGKTSWHEPVKETLSHLNYAKLNSERDRGDEEREEKAQRQLAAQLIDIGYKVLATKLHPDKGGSPAAMARLNSVRSHLRKCCESINPSNRIRRV